MLKRRFRIPRGIRINNNRLLSSPFFLLKIKKNGLLFNRFAVIVSKKIDKRATVRNKIRRIINTCIQEMRGNLIQGQDMLIIVKKEIVGKTKQEVCLSLAENMGRI